MLFFWRVMLHKLLLRYFSCLLFFSAICPWCYCSLPLLYCYYFYYAICYLSCLLFVYAPLIFILLLFIFPSLRAHSRCYRDSLRYYVVFIAWFFCSDAYFVCRLIHAAIFHWCRQRATLDMRDVYAYTFDICRFHYALLFIFSELSPPSTCFSLVCFFSLHAAMLPLMRHACLLCWCLPLIFLLMLCWFCYAVVDAAAHFSIFRCCPAATIFTIIFIFICYVYVSIRQRDVAMILFVITPLFRYSFAACWCPSRLFRHFPAIAAIILISPLFLIFAYFIVVSLFFVFAMPHVRCFARLRSIFLPCWCHFVSPLFSRLMFFVFRYYDAHACCRHAIDVYDAAIIRLLLLRRLAAPLFYATMLEQMLPLLLCSFSEICDAVIFRLFRCCFCCLIPCLPCRSFRRYYAPPFFADYYYIMLADVCHVHAMLVLPLIFAWCAAYRHGYFVLISAYSMPCLYAFFMFFFFFRAAIWWRRSLYRSPDAMLTCHAPDVSARYSAYVSCQHIDVVWYLLRHVVFASAFFAALKRCCFRGLSPICADIWFFWCQDAGDMLIRYYAAVHAFIAAFCYPARRLFWWLPSYAWWVLRSCCSLFWCCLLLPAIAILMICWYFFYLSRYPHATPLFAALILRYDICCSIRRRVAVTYYADAHVYLRCLCWGRYSPPLRARWRYFAISLRLLTILFRVVIAYSGFLMPLTVCPADADDARCRFWSYAVHYWCSLLLFAAFYAPYFLCCLFDMSCFARWCYYVAMLMLDIRAPLFNDAWLRPFIRDTTDIIRLMRYYALLWWRLMPRLRCLRGDIFIFTYTICRYIDAHLLMPPPCRWRPLLLLFIRCDAVFATLFCRLLADATLLCVACRYADIIVSRYAAALMILRWCCHTPCLLFYVEPPLLPLFWLLPAAIIDATSPCRLFSCYAACFWFSADVMLFALAFSAPHAWCLICATIARRAIITIMLLCLILCPPLRVISPSAAMLFLLRYILLPYAFRCHAAYYYWLLSIQVFFAIFGYAIRHDILSVWCLRWYAFATRYLLIYHAACYWCFCCYAMLLIFVPFRHIFFVLCSSLFYIILLLCLRVSCFVEVFAVFHATPLCLRYAR